MIQYSSADLYDLRRQTSCSSYANTLPKEIRRRKRGKSSGIKKRLRQSKFRPYLPAIIMGNVNSLSNKIDELCGNIRFLSDFRNANILSFTETWLKEVYDDSHFVLDGFKFLRGDRSEEESRKTKGGGVCIYVNQKWCHPNNIIIKLKSCSEYLEILAVTLRPYYLPREFTHIIFCVIYIPNKSHEKYAIIELSEIIQNLYSAAPDACFILNGDFNRCELGKTAVKFHQHVSIPTRRSASLDLLYSNVPDAYTSVPLPNLGKSDHNLIHLIPKYRPLIQRERPKKIKVQLWNESTRQQLQGSLECTDWDMFVHSTGDIHELTDTVSAYIKFCIDTSIPRKTIKIYPNDKPWISSLIKTLIRQKRSLFYKGEKEKLVLVKKKLKKVIHKRKVAYKDKIENHFITNDLKSVWKGIKIISGYGKVNETDKSPLQNLTTEYANELNLFYNRFDKYDFSTEICELESMFKNSGGLDIVVSEEDVRRKFGRLNSSKAAGPDKISAQVLRSCSSQLAKIYSIIFNMCFSSCIIPNLWKQSCIVPIPKKSCISSMNDLRPVALTPIAMKVCEEFFLQHLKPLVNSFLDPLQFAYQPSRGCDDAILFTLEKLYSHLEKSHCGHSARVMFFDFSSAFNTIQPHKLAKKLCNMDVPTDFIKWIINYLTNRTQYVRLSPSVQSEIVTSSTGAPQGTKCAPFLFILYTSDYRSSDESCPIIKFADDTALIGLIKNDNDDTYCNLIQEFIKYAEQNFLEINISKTKELLIDFRRNSIEPCLVIIKNLQVERTSTYKYLGVIFNNKLKWDDHVDKILKKLNSRLYCLYKMKKFNVQPQILKLFFNSVLCSVDKKSLIGYNNHQSVEILRNTSRVVNLSFARYLRGVKYEQLQKATATSEPEPPTESTIMAQVHGPGPGPGLDPESDLNDNAESEALEFAGPLDLLTENHLKQTWSEILGPDYKIVVAQITKFHKKGGLGISLEGTVDVEDGEEVRPHHYIRSILDDGPVGINSELMSGDELLEVNGIKLLGLNHVDVVAILKELPMHVRMVCARSTEVPVSSEYGYEFEDLHDTLKQELSEIGSTHSLQKLMPMTDRLVKAKSDGSLAAVPSNVLETSFSRMKSRSLEPLTGLATWSTEPQIIELTKGDKGLGFSILDYQDPLNPKETVIVIRSLVPGGVAQQDGQLKPGDRLMSVNDMNLESASLETAVQALKGAPKGVVRIAVAKPLPFPDGASNADSHQMGRMDLHLPIMPDKVTVTKSTPPQNDGISIDSNNDEKVLLYLLQCKALPGLVWRFLQKFCSKLLLTRDAGGNSCRLCACYPEGMCGLGDDDDYIKVLPDYHKYTPLTIR
ncbi:Patj [Nymphon striatum]|nr:Patj [Nymphon striatum]